MAKHKSSKSSKIRAYFEAHPNATPAQVAKALKINVQYVYVVRSLLKKETKEGVNIDSAHDGTSLIAVMTSDKSVADMTPPAPPAPDVVNHPPHYKDGGIETIDYIEAKRLGYHLGNVVKYISRAGKKGTANGLEDLRKAQWYLARAIEKNEYSPCSR